MALLLSKVAGWIMSHHLYSFNDEIYHQSDGTPIGLQIAVNISRIVMMDWDMEMMTLVISMNIRMELFLRYVDDVNLIIVVEHEVDKTVDQLEIEYAQMITTKADSIFPDVLKFEHNLGQYHTSKKLPILDLECWVEPDNNVSFSFYKKEVNSDAILGPNSGFSPKVLRNILVQEYLRRLLNCSRSLNEQIKYQFLN